MTKNQEATAVQNNDKMALIDEDENTQMHYSAALGKTEDFDSSMTGKLNVENYLGWTPLMMACRNGHVSTVKVLLDLSADATKKNKFGTSTFLISISSGKLEIVTMILNNLLTGGISRRCLQNTLSPLSLAILFRHQDVLEYLVGQKFDINAATPVTGITPLMFASAMEDCPAYTLLIKKKADTTMKNCLGATADEIKQSRNQKRAPQKEKETKPLTPAELISMSPHMNAFRPPYYFISPQNSFILVSPNPVVQLRKSSNAQTPSPNIVMAPNVTPITPMGCGPQFFFPPDFVGGQQYCGAVPCSPFGEFLNVRLNQSSGMFLSPNVVNDSSCATPCV
ncbi:unnamed protein product [Phaedon cochleariae]|uniref:Uncharacterized protein n=1 Tax=Phaedon cochleariae TaxID=80249 RepID=A0A9P0GR51_PHACE|nr:unnamed protein product [Phaedon cochleariae]